MSQEILKVAGLQLDLHWEQVDNNLNQIEGILSSLEKVDLIVLPEMFTTGFSMQPSLFWKSADKALKFMQYWAHRTRAAITGSVIAQENNQYFNRLFFVNPDGSFKIYDKRHLFTLAGEEKVYSPGKEKLLVDYLGWHINPQICYDLRFPVWCRYDVEFDLQIFVANWPERRNTAWKSLLKARSIENMAYTMGLNRVGEDGNGVYHSGDSAVYGPLGGVIAQAVPGKAEVFYAALSKQDLKKQRSKFSFLNDRDSFTLDL